MKYYYVAIKGNNPIQVQFKNGLTQQILDTYIQVYGLSFIGIYETYQDAKKAIEVDYFLFGNDKFNKVDTINFLEKCLALKLDTNI